MILTLNEVAYEAEATANGELVFDLPASDLNALAVGTYPLTASAHANARNYAVEAIEVGSVTVAEAIKLPKSFRATKGFGYQLFHATPGQTTKLNNKRVSIDEGGFITAKKTGKSTLTVTTDGIKQTCKITVVANKYVRKKPLMKKDEAALFSSTKRLYYKGGKLYAEVFVLNRTGQAVQSLEGLTFELRSADALLYAQALAPWTFKSPLKHKRFKVYKLVITEDMLPGVKDKAIDLGLGGVQATLVGPVEPLTPSAKGAIAAKDAAEDDAAPADEPAEQPAATNEEEPATDEA